MGKLDTPIFVARTARIRKPRSQRVWQRTVLTTIVLVLTSGCFIRTSVRYEPEPLPTSEEAMQVIQRTLEGQHGKYAPIEVTVTEEKISLLRTSSGPLWGSSMARTTIRYTAIGEVSLSRKSGWYATTLVATNGATLLHIYTADLSSAEEFMDAIATMRRISSPKTSR